MRAVHASASLILADVALLALGAPLPSTPHLFRPLSARQSQSATPSASASTGSTANGTSASSTVPLPSIAAVTFGDLIAPSTGGTFDDFVAAQPAEQSPVAGSSSANGGPVVARVPSKHTRVVSRAKPDSQNAGKSEPPPPAKAPPPAKGKPGAAPAAGAPNPANVVPAHGGKTQGLTFDNNNSNAGGSGTPPPPPPAPSSPPAQGPPPPGPAPDHDGHNVLGFLPALRNGDDGGGGGGGGGGLLNFLGNALGGGGGGNPF